MTDAEMPIFTRSYDLLAWLLLVTNNFPRAHRHTFTRRLCGATLSRATVRPSAEDLGDR